MVAATRWPRRGHGDAHPPGAGANEDGRSNPVRASIARLATDRAYAIGMGQLPWPKLFRVTLKGIDGETRSYTALSWIGPYKALAMAMQVHTGSDGRRRQKAWPVYDVDVEDLGWAPKSEDGTVAEGPPGCLDDRMEF